MPKRKAKNRPRIPGDNVGVLFELRSSPIAGTGVFALQPIPKGTRLIEYIGERISHEEADKRYDDEPPGSASHVVLFTVDRHTVVDAGVGGNEARFFNHSCDPNCESEVEQGHIYLDAIRDIKPGEELTYDYALTRDKADDEAEEARYPCRCGSKNCRGTLLEPRKKRRSRPKKARKSARAKRRDSGRTKQFRHSALSGRR